MPMLIIPSTSALPPRRVLPATLSSENGYCNRGQNIRLFFFKVEEDSLAYSMGGQYHCYNCSARPVGWICSFRWL